MNARLYFAQLIELVKRSTVFDNKTKVIYNGDDNDYAEKVERLIENSITAKSCSKLYKQYITGKGFPSLNNVIVNPIKEINLFSFFSEFNDEFSLHRGVAVHVHYELSGAPVSYDVLPLSYVRLGKKDDKDYNGMYAVCKNWHVKEKKITWVHAFNDDPNVVLGQIENAGGIKKYTGQLFLFNPTNYDYPLSHIHSCLNDADSEFRISVFKNKNLRKGVYGKKIFVIPPMIDNELRLTPRERLTSEQVALLRIQENFRDDFKKKLQGFVGVENNEGMLLAEMEYEGDDISKVFNIIDVKTEINDTLFENTEKTTANNLRKAYNNVPSILIENSDNSIFGQSGELLKQAKVFYQEQTEDDRMLILNALKRLFNNFYDINSELLIIDKLIEEKPREEEKQDINAIAQAELRGSVGRVTALLQVQQSVSQGITDLEAGVNIIKEIYGFSEDVARQMLGTPKSVTAPILKNR